MKPRRKGAPAGLSKANSRENWLKEINNAIRFEKAYLRVKVKGKEFD